MLDRRSFALTSPDKQTVPVGMDRGILDIGSSVLDIGSAFFFALTGRDKYTVSGGMDKGILDIGPSFLDIRSACFRSQRSG